MTISRKALCVFYALVALAALLGTWGNNIQYLNLGFLQANVHFYQETTANPASRSITVDIFFLMLAATTWMVLEARRLGLRGVWLYVVFGILVAISFTFPIFLIQRELELAKRDPGTPAGSLLLGDLLGLALLAIVSVAYAVLTLTR